MATVVYDVAVIGGGIVGTATAMALTQQFGVRVVVLEAENKLAAHQTGNNSGVIHSGLYYKPGSLKARLCTEGREAMYRFCGEHGIAHERCSKLVIATEPEELPRLDELIRRGEANGLQGMTLLDAEGIREYEPHAAGIRGLHVPDTGIVDYPAVTAAYARVAEAGGATVLTNARVTGCARRGGEIVLETAAGEIYCKALVNTGGLRCDEIARLCGDAPGVQIVPFRGEYYTLRPERASLVKNLIYPVPDPRFPFLGVHLTRMVHGGVEAGPNAVLAFKREGYTKSDVSLRDMASLAAYGGFWRMGLKHWKTAISEFHRSFSKKTFAHSLARLVPEITEADLAPGGAGVRAQAVDPSGGLVDDFKIVESDRMIHVLNAPSPAATASLRIGEYIATLAGTRFGLSTR